MSEWPPPGFKAAPIEIELVELGKPRARIPGTYPCGCQLGSGQDCPKMSCPGKFPHTRARAPLDSELYLADAPL